MPSAGLALVPCTVLCCIAPHRKLCGTVCGTLRDREDYRRRLKDVCAYINENYEVESLCRELPLRIQMLIDSGGDRISK